jgi:hypothetical protein
VSGIHDAMWVCGLALLAGAALTALLVPAGLSASATRTSYSAHRSR